MFADPELPGDFEAADFRQAGVFASPLSLGPLPHARREARAFRRLFGGAADVLTGESATESKLKETDLGPYGVLHFAAHAIVDNAHAERSAVVLAPGGPSEDGLLQFREVLDLDMDGKLVILSTCQSASGPARAAGPMGLAGAFFEAGARTVVASLWPMRDEETAELVEELTRQLGRGQTVSGALSRAQRSMLDRGAPPIAWSGLVVMGDGEFTPFPGDASGGQAAPLWRAGIALVAFAVAMTVFRAFQIRRRRRA